MPRDAALAEAIDRGHSYELEPQREFERVLAVSVLDRAISRLEREQADHGQQERFLALKAWLVAEPSEVEFSSVAKALGLGMTTARMARHMLRQRLAQFVQEEISNLLERRDDAEGLHTEMANLLGALAG